jgi:hypothetical protein
MKVSSTRKGVGWLGGSFLFTLFAGLAAVGCESGDGSSPTTGVARSALLEVEGSECTTLYAGQHIDAGEVCVTVDEDELVVSYATTGDWELVETHTWVGESLDDLPTTPKGNPKVGHFPYQSGDIAGATYYESRVPLGELGDEEYLCDRTFLVAAHAALARPDGEGGYQTETGWGDGKPIVERGSWATYFWFTFSCEDDTDPPPDSGCDTAFAFGPTTFVDLGLTDSRWGWQYGPFGQGAYSTPIYAGAGGNDISKGYQAGTLYVTYDGATVEVDYIISLDYTLEETHLYVSGLPVDTISPGQFGHQHDLEGASQDSYSISGFDGESLYLVAHGVVCEKV